jgi:hypothetical protein
MNGVAKFLDLHQVPELVMIKLLTLQTLLFINLNWPVVKETLGHICRNLKGQLENGGYR